jgi:hypothetical protein
MKINTKFLNEAKQFNDRWSKHMPLLKGIKKYSRSQTAVLLEGQRLANEMPTKRQIENLQHRQRLVKLRALIPSSCGEG